MVAFNESDLMAAAPSAARDSNQEITKMNRKREILDGTNAMRIPYDESK